MNPFANPSPARLMVRLSSPGAGSFAAGLYSSGVFIRAHRSPFSASRSASDCLCRSLAAEVITLRRKVRSAAVAHVWWLVCSMAASVFFLPSAETARDGNPTCEVFP